MWGEGGEIQMTLLHCSQAETLEACMCCVVFPDVVSFTVLASAISDKAKVQRWVSLHFKWKHTLASVLIYPR
jgi:hypothetical protein